MSDTPGAYVADAGAMIAYVRKEPGGEVFRATLRAEDAVCYAHAANLAEVFYDFLRSDGEDVALSIIQDLLAVGVGPREDMDSAFWQDVARIKAGPNPSFADCFCLALARRVDGIVLTTDHHELDNDAVRALCRIRFVR